MLEKEGRDPECGIDCLKDAGKTLFLVPKCISKVFGSGMHKRNLTENHSTKSRCQRGCVFPHFR